jgi:hypothetical protein
MEAMSDLRAVIYAVGIWGGVIVPVAFAIYYSFIADWWRNPTGRTVIALDVCIFALRAERLGEFFRHHDHFTPVDWLVAGVNLAIPLIILYRMGSYELKRRTMKRQARETAERLKLIFTGLVP